MKIAVILGGNSAERDVSISSGIQVSKALRSCGHDVVAVDAAIGVLSNSKFAALAEESVKSLPPSVGDTARLHSEVATLSSLHDHEDVDLFFMALHGGIGENGTIQAILDVADCTYTGSAHIGSTLAMDKDISKKIFAAVGIDTPDWLMAPTSNEEVVKKLGFPVVIKANKQGSTIGLSVVKCVEELDPAIRRARQHDDEVMIEKFVSGRELTVGILGDTALAVGEIRPRNAEIFDYASKYQTDGAEEIFPADLPLGKTAEVQDIALKVHVALKLRDYSRIDFIMDETGKVWCLEANSLPGLTPTSLLPQSAAATGITFPELCERICILATSRSTA